MALPGCYRAYIASVSDDERRQRYRVRVPHLHDESAPISALPWAEIGCAFAAKDAGDIPHYEVDEGVWVMFEGGDRRFPVIMGGWIGYGSGVNDLSPDQSEDYENGRRRWMRRDRAGNTIEMSEVEEELHILLQSGQARITISQHGDTVSIEAEGPVNVTGKQVKVVAENAVVQADSVAIEAQDGEAKMTAVNGDVIVNADDAHAVEIGQFVDDLSVPRQAKKVRAGAEEIQLGEAVPTGARLPTLIAVLEGLTKSAVGHDQTANTEMRGIQIAIGTLAATVLATLKAQQIDIGDPSQTTLGKFMAQALQIGDVALTNTLDLMAQTIKMGGASTLLTEIDGITVRMGGAGTTLIEIKGSSGILNIDVLGGVINIGQTAALVNIG